MKKLLLCGVCALGFVGTVSTVLAGNRPIVEPLFGWKLVREGDACQALANYADGSRISYGFKRDGSIELSISFNGDKYKLPDKVSVDFDGGATYVLTRVPNSSPGSWQMDPRWANDFAAAIINGRMMNLNIEEQPVASFSLAGSAAGISKAHSCSVGASAPAQPPAPAQPRLNASNCDKVIEGHGFFSRAQFQCGFANYDQGRIDDARECRAIVGQAKTSELLKSGFDVYDSQERKWGRPAWCAELAKNPAFK